MNYTITLPADFPTTDIRTLLETDWLVPRKVRHFLRTRRNVQVNDQPVLFHHTVEAGDRVTLFFEESDYTLPTIGLGDSKLVTPLYEDEHLLIVDKPVGVKTHPNQPDETDTLLNHVAAYLQPKAQLPYVVHRLDKETSGAILFAKNPFVLPILGRMLENRLIHRTYHARVSGITKQNDFTLTKKIGRDRHDRRKRCIDERHGKDAVTHVRVLEKLTNEKETRLSCWLETGRTHQIRVHLQSIGHPVVGDPLYQTGLIQVPRLMLHAKSLAFTHPFTKEKITVDTLSDLWSKNS